MKSIKKLILVPLIFLLINCSESNSESNQEAVCDSTNTEFNQIFNQLVTGNMEHTSMDTEVHGYKFEVASPKNICSIGYQSISSMETIPYTIEIRNNTTNTVLYSGNHFFSSSATTYVTLGSIPVAPGNSYSIKRIQTNWGANIGNTVGRIVTNLTGDFTFPITQGDLRITESIFGDTGGFEGELNSTLPYVDIVFEE